MAPVTEIITSSEDVLWNTLEQVLGDPDSLDSLASIVIDGWQPELLYFPDDPDGHIVSPTTARAIIDFHSSLSRAYAQAVYGAPDARLLHEEDKDGLDLRIYVKQGSNGFDVTEKGLQNLILAMADKMTGDQISIAIIVFLLLYFSSSLGRHWISKAYEERREERGGGERVALGELETKRAQIMADALSKYSNLKPMDEVADAGKLALVKAASRSPKSRVIGADLTGEEARIIVSRTRGSGEGHKLDGIFEITKLIIEHEGGYIVRLRDTDSGREFDAEINYSELLPEDIHLIFGAAERKEPVKALVNAWFIEDNITRASIIRAENIDRSAE